MDQLVRPQINGLYFDKIDDNTFFVYDPCGNRGIIFIDKLLYNMIHECDGYRDIDSIAKKYDQQPDELIEQLSKLEKYGIVEFKDHKNVRKPLKKKTKRFDTWMHITNNCNLDCTYCYIDKSSGQMPLELAYKYIDKMAESCLNNNIPEMTVRFAGGEPLTQIDSISHVIEYCKKTYQNLNSKFAVITNGTLLTPQVADFLLNNKIAVSISLDGTEKYHNLTRLSHNNSNVFKMTMDGIIIAKEKGLNPYILTTITPDNLDGLSELTKLLIGLKLRFRYSLQKEYGKKPLLTEYEKPLIAELTKSIQIMEDAITSGNHGFDFNFNDIQFNKFSVRTCGAGTMSFASGEQGEIGLCGMGLKKPFMKLDESHDLFQDINMINNELSDFSVDNTPKCSSCVWKHSCAGGCPVQNESYYGTYNHESPYCNVIRQIIPAYIHMKANMIWSKYNAKEVTGCL